VRDSMKGLELVLALALPRSAICSVSSRLSGRRGWAGLVRRPTPRCQRASRGRRNMVGIPRA
jgi:hypothetical protein